jgi:hypothetical protein
MKGCQIVVSHRLRGVEPAAADISRISVRIQRLAPAIAAYSRYFMARVWW